MTPYEVLVSSLTLESRRRLDEVLGIFRDSKFEATFVQALLHPPMDIPKLQGSFPIPPEELGVVLELAQEAILADPKLALCSELLRSKVEAVLIRYYGSLGIAQKTSAKVPCCEGCAEAQTPCGGCGVQK